MQRLFQLGTLILLATTLLVPLSESLDRWDKPGLGNDTEFHLFAIVLFLALVLLLTRLVARAASALLPVVWQWRAPIGAFCAGMDLCRKTVPMFAISPPVPLRI